MKLYSVKDVATEKFGPVFEMETELAAVRAFRNSIKDNPFKYDLQLYYLGEFDSDNGGLLPNLTFVFKETNENESAV